MRRRLNVTGIHPMPHPWRPAYDEAAALGLKVAVCDAKAHLLACSNIEGHVLADAARLYGAGWWEFVDPAALPAVKAYFANGASGDSITYGQLCQIDGAAVMADITLVKTWVGGAWLCYGAVRARRQPVRRRQLGRGD